GTSGDGVGRYVGWGIVGVVVVLVGVGAWWLLNEDEESFAGCNVVGINVHGCIMTYAPAADEGTSGVPEGCGAMAISEEIIGTLEQASQYGNIRAVLLDIDSTGGQAQAAVEIEDALTMAGLPSVAWIRGYGDSAAYWVASAASTIIASKESDIGSIGVTSSYTDYSRQNASEGITYNSISTGKYKDMGNPDKPLTPEERAVIEKSLRITLDNFVQTIARNRDLPVEKVRELADGSTWLGEEALSLGLIDKLGTYPTVLEHLREVLQDEPVICWR
ncbi:MAG: signal peptide peptidase SppA, partial [Patescibacteria group bacterium]